MLSYMGDVFVAEYLQRQELKGYTENSITDRDTLKEELARTRQRGYAVDDMEHEFGIKCIAMPVLDRSRNVYAAVSISGLATHFTEEHISEWAILLKKYINKIESRL